MTDPMPCRLLAISPCATPQSDTGPRQADTGEVPTEPPTPIPAALGAVVIAIDHVGIAVPDLEKAVTFYTAAFGLEVRHREVNSEQGVAEAMLAPVSAPPGVTHLQLLAPLTPDSTIATFIARSGPGLQQLAYRVEDVDRAASVLRGMGLRLLYDAAKRGTNDSMINFVHPKDTGGVLIELVQAPARLEGTD
jgi:methylmalonyl-CoA/ethylmalonyl-CoA epimerase